MPKARKAHFESSGSPELIVLVHSAKSPLYPRPSEEDNSDPVETGPRERGSFMGKRVGVDRLRSTSGTDETSGAPDVGLCDVPRYRAKEAQDS
jgi:hypothetical protein